MDLTLTLAASALFLVLAVVCGWLGARPINVLKGPRMVPWRPLMMVCVVALMLMMVHLANLLGFQTGNQPRY
jgi:Kef-type K+ transport system membrane component KefB